MSNKPNNNQTVRVPVLSPDGQPLMPTLPSRARRWLRDGKAKVVHNDLGIFQIQLVLEPSGRELQDISVGIDPGKKFSGVGVQSAKATLFKCHVILPFVDVTRKMKARRILRRARRGRRINRTIAFKQRVHKQIRFDNRRHKKLPPSIKANRLLELRILKEIGEIFPVSKVFYEYVEAKGNKGFSPVMVGQKVMLEWIKALCVEVQTRFGWETSMTRKHLGLVKNKEDKAVQTPETHANDGIALAACNFVSYQKFQTDDTHGHHWFGDVQITDAPFRIIARPNLYRRQLHFENPDSGKPNCTHTRKRKGGTITPFGFRSGDLVIAKKADKEYIGWIGGYTETEKTKNVSIYDINWKRIGQFTPSKVKLLQRKTGLLVAH